MRLILAGLLILLSGTSLLAQTKGEVESIGFGSYYRPDCWTPMVIKLRPGTLAPGTYQIQVEQKDLDEDTQVFTRAITVNAGEAARDQRFGMYFLPQPSNGGLPDAGAMASLRDLNADLKVWLCTEAGKQIEPLPLTSTIRSIDAGSINGRAIGRKFVLCITDGSSKPVYHGVDTNVYGLTEDVGMITIRPDELPENVLGYHGVDAVVWMSGDSDQLSKAGSRRLPALTEFVRLGGKLVVTQPSERGKVEALETLLPIQLKDAAGNWLVEMVDRTSTYPLSAWAKPELPNRDPQFNAWQRLRGPFKVARARVVKDGAVVAEKLDWREGTPAATQPGSADETPYLVRWGVGLGQVTWVAQNLGDLALTRNPPPGWIGVWNRVFDVKDDPRPRIIGDFNTEKAMGGGGTIDLGRSFTEGMEHSARGAGLVVLAIGFFIAYWVLAGPVSYFVLAGKKKSGMSWPIFGASALVATLLTVGVVRLVMGASADIHHITFVRAATGQPTVVESRIGVYLTKSSNIPLSLGATDPNFVSYVSAFNPHPKLFSSAGGFVGKERYAINIPDAGSGEPVEISVPFRSTLKKLQARWAGQLPGIEGSPKLIEASMERTFAELDGRLTNATGRDLAEVYFAFTGRTANGQKIEDYLFYVPRWNKDAQLDLLKQVSDPKLALNVGTGTGNAVPGQNKVLGGKLALAGWLKYWRDGGAGDSTGSIGSDSRYTRSFPMVSLYERLPFHASSDTQERFDILRRGARHLDVSQSVSAGRLVILAQDAANNLDGKTLSTVPFPLEVDNDKTPSSGVTFYQFSLPLTRVVPAAKVEPAVEK